MDMEEAEAKLIEAARYRSLGGLRFFLKRAVNLNAQDAQGRSALHWAAERGEADMVKEILECGAWIDAKLKDSIGETALHKAAWAGSEPVARILIKAGFSLEEANAEGRKPGEMFAERGIEVAG